MRMGPTEHLYIWENHYLGNMNIAIIGTGNVGGALATNWSDKGHAIHLGVRSFERFKGTHLLKNPNTKAYSIPQAVSSAEVILIATPPTAIVELVDMMRDVSGKVIIDATNAVRQTPDPYPTVYHFLADRTKVYPLPIPYCPVSFGD